MLTLGWGSRKVSVPSMRTPHTENSKSRKTYTRIFTKIRSEFRSVLTQHGKSYTDTTSTLVVPLPDQPSKEHAHTTTEPNCNSLITYQKSSKPSYNSFSWFSTLMERTIANMTVNSVMPREMTRWDSDLIRALDSFIMFVLSQIPHAAPTMGETILEIPRYPQNRERCTLLRIANVMKSSDNSPVPVW